MRADEEPVDGTESVLRLIHSSYFRADLPLPVQPEAFRPLDKGEKGISVFREKFAKPEQALLAVAEGKRRLYYVARISVQNLAALNLTVQPDPIDAVPGHAIIPELNTTDYHKDKALWKTVQRQLAELASRDIVYRAQG